jgi:hypothetical protein
MAAPVPHSRFTSFGPACLSSVVKCYAEALTTNGHNSHSLGHPKHCRSAGGIDVSSIPPEVILSPFADWTDDAGSWQPYELFEA